MDSWPGDQPAFSHRLGDNERESYTVETEGLFPRLKTAYVRGCLTALPQHLKTTK
jgi:hypothetical protein